MRIITNPDNQKYIIRREHLEKERAFLVVEQSHQRAIMHSLKTQRTAWDKYISDYAALYPMCKLKSHSDFYSFFRKSLSYIKNRIYTIDRELKKGVRSADMK